MPRRRPGAPRPVPLGLVSERLLLAALTESSKAGRQTKKPKKRKNKVRSVRTISGGAFESNRRKH